MRQLAVFVCLVFAGCASTQPSVEVGELKRRLDDAQRRQATDEQKLQELEDRVFLLTDQIESQKVASTRRGEAPKLPVVTLKPASEETTVSDEETPGEAIEYQGDARTPTPEKVRPMIHLDESRAPRTRHASSSSVSAPAPAQPPADLPRENLGVAPAPPVSGIAAAAKGERETPPAADPLKLYRAAYDSLRAGRHDEAVREFREFVRRYPRHDYADNAQYWLGECFYDRKQYVEAASEFRAVVARYPLGNKAPDALLKLGYCLIAVGQGERGRELLAQVPSTYPRTEAARLASERLAEMKEPK